MGVPGKVAKEALKKTLKETERPPLKPPPPQTLADPVPAKPKGPLAKPAESDDLPYRDEEGSLIIPVGHRPDRPKWMAPGDEGQAADDILETELKSLDPDETHHVNFDMLTVEEDVAATIGAVAEKNKGSIDEARRNVITHEQLKGLAEDLDFDSEVVAAVLMRESGGVLNAETIVAARQVMNQSALRLYRLAQLIKAGDASDIEKMAFRRQWDLHNEFQVQLMGARAEAGRALGAWGIPMGTNDIQLGRMRELADTLQGGNLDEMADIILMQDGAKGIGKVTREYQGSRILGSLNELYIGSILSGLKTHEVNFTGNLGFFLMNVTETAVAAQIGKFMPGASHVEVGEATAMMMAAINSWKESLHVGWKAMKAGESVDAMSKYEMSHRKMISTEMWPEVKKARIPAIDKLLEEGFGVDKPILAMALDAFGVMARFPMERILAPADDYAKNMLRRAAIAQLAHREATVGLRNGTLTEETVGKFMDDFVNRPSKEVLALAEDAALYGTFQTPLGKRMQTVQRVFRQMPGGFLIVPFMRTPIVRQSHAASLSRDLSPQQWLEVFDPPIFRFNQTGR